MRRLHLIVCCFLSAFSASLWAGGLRNPEGKPALNVERVAHKPAKLAGRANNSNQDGVGNKNAQYPVYTQAVHEKKPLTKEERRALRNQINQTENRYPKQN